MTVSGRRVVGTDGPDSETPMRQNSNAWKALLDAWNNRLRVQNCRRSRHLLDRIFLG